MHDGYFDERESKRIVLAFTIIALLAVLFVVITREKCSELKEEAVEKAAAASVETDTPLYMKCEEVSGKIGYRIVRCENEEVICYVKGTDGLFCLRKGERSDDCGEKGDGTKDEHETGATSHVAERR